MNFDNYVFRSHMVGHIVSPPRPLSETARKQLNDFSEREDGNGRPLTDKQKETLIDLRYKELKSKKYELTTTAKNICSNIVGYEKHGRRKTLESQYLDKGIANEKESRDLMSRILGVPLVYDGERKTNDWVTGQRDIKHDKIVFDIKSKWDYETFNKSLIEGNNEIYLRQLDCYMDLWDIKDSILCHVLTNTPFNLIEGMIRKEDWKNDILDINGEVRDEKIGKVVSIVESAIYTRQGLEDFCTQSGTIHLEWFADFVEIPENERIHMVAHPFQKERIEQRNESIKIAREFMNTVKPINNIIKI